LYRIIKSHHVDVEETITIPSYEEELSETEENDDIYEEDIQEVAIAEAIKYKMNIEKEAYEILQDAKIQSQIIVEEAEKEGAEIKKEAQSFSDNLKLLKSKEGYEEGFQRGYKESMQKYSDLIISAQNILNEAEGYKESVSLSMESEIIQLVISSVEKITRKLLDEKDEIVINIIKHSLEAMNFRDSLTLKVSSEDFDSISFAKDKILAMFPGIKTIDIRIMDAYRKGDLEIESESGIVNPSVSYQIKKLKKEFSKITSDDEVIL